MPKFNSDKPIDELTADEFGRVFFVEDFMNVLRELEYRENYIISLNSKWGDGKTSTINLMVNKLNAADGFIAVYVSAWAFRGDYELIIWDILDQTSKKITNKEIHSKWSKFGKVLSNASKAEYPFDLNSEFDFNGNGINETRTSSSKIINTIGYVGQMLASSDGIAKARKRIENAIKGKKVIVFIDDLDRLEGKQIIDILGALSTVAAYGGMTYVLSFDKKYVSAAIEECLPKGQSGEEYLEKIIQVPINLPALTREAIDSNFLHKLYELLSKFDLEIDEDESERFQELYFWGVNRYINSPRSINRMINALKFRIPVIKGELNIVDTVILEIIRVFDGRFYEDIRVNAGLLIRQKDIKYNAFLLDDNGNKRKESIEKSFLGLKEASSYKLGILKSLFPEVSQLYENYSQSMGTDEKLRSLKRISSRYYFDSYFASIGVELGSVSTRRIIEALQIDDPNKQLEKLDKIINQSNFDLGLRIIMDNRNLVRDRMSFSLVLLDLVDMLPNKYESTGLGLSPFNTVLYRINEILINSDNPLENYLNLMDHNYNKRRLESLPFLFREVDLSNQGENRKIAKFTDDQVNTYREEALRIIRNLANEGTIPIATTDNSMLLYSYWLRFGKNREEISDYIKQNISTADEAVDFLSQFLTKWTTMGKNDYHRNDFDSDTYSRIRGYVDPTYLYKILASDSRYSQFVNIGGQNLPTLENRYDEESNVRHLSRVGNEKDKAFREIVAQQFMWYHKNNENGS